MYTKSINLVWWPSCNKKNDVFVKLNTVVVRDVLWENYFTTRTMILSDSIGGEIRFRIHIDEHLSPLYLRINSLCTNKKNDGKMTKFNIFSKDLAKVRLTTNDGTMGLCNRHFCFVLPEHFLLNSFSVGITETADYDSEAVGESVNKISGQIKAETITNTIIKKVATLAGTILQLKASISNTSNFITDSNK
uniref:Uncharacterized protein n=1 Tax=Glossina austeni TaxID=7395 RepID=A0A1A9VMA3_GLOAU